MNRLLKPPKDDADDLEVVGDVACCPVFLVGASYR